MIRRLLAHDTVRRAVRTFAQAFVATLAFLLPADVVLDVVWWQDVIVAGAYSGLVSLVTFLHVELEDAGRVRDTRGVVNRGNA